MSPDVHRLSIQETLTITKGARMAGLRWDVLPWALVLDLDAPVSSNEDEMRRVWIAFIGISEISGIFDRARVPNGVWISGDIGVTELPDHWKHYVFSALLPTHDETGHLVGFPAKTIEVRAQGIVGIASKGAAKPGEFNSLTLSQRLGLGSDEHFVHAVIEQPL